MNGKHVKCPECGSEFSSEKLLKEHFNVKHSEKDYSGSVTENKDFLSNLGYFKKFLNTSFALGVVAGLLLASAGVTGALVYDEYRSMSPIEVTVISCDECSYERLENTTNRMFRAEYKEINYQSDEGQDLIEKYDLRYVPGFIFEKKVEERENFSQARTSLLEFEDAYIMSDRREEVSQRFSEGFYLNE